ncbi:MAG: glycosyltransferase family 2 protein [Lachnospiraceae bacterium]|nr:glycosyltransferase family 2 protein [Lachnospiraceae bacterium]
MESKCRYRKVAVLLSSYNGERFIREQIESICAQTYPNLTLYVRDDGSTDGTVEILEEYQRQEKLVLLKGENLGFIGSFFRLLRDCGRADGGFAQNPETDRTEENPNTADYYAWCDQDDIWMPDKIERAVEWLEKDRMQHPVLYFAGYDYYDENMKFEKHGLVHERGPSFANSLMDCIPLGFTSVFNSKAREMMLAQIPEHCCGHDWWTYMVCAAFGRVLYDKEYCAVKYRRLQTSVSPGGKNFIALQIWRFRKFFMNDYFAKIREQLREFAAIYGEQLSPENRKIMKLFTGSRYSLPRALKKTFYPVWFRQGLTEELMVRVLFLIGRL